MSPRYIDDATREAREEEMMQAALNIIARDGVSGLTIDKVVTLVPYSKGTVYNTFSCKEDLLTALCNRSVTRLSDIFFRAASFDGNSREKMLAIGIGYMLHSQLNPTEFMMVISAKTPSVTEKSSQKRQEEHQELETQLLGKLLGIISEALAMRRPEPGATPKPCASGIFSVGHQLWYDCAAAGERGTLRRTPADVIGERAAQPCQSGAGRPSVATIHTRMRLACIGATDERNSLCQRDGSVGSALEHAGITVLHD